MHLKVKIKYKNGQSRREMINEIVAETINAIKNLDNYLELRLQKKLTECVFKIVTKESKHFDIPISIASITSSIIVSAYDLSHHEKNELEKQIESIVTHNKCRWMKIAKWGVKLVTGLAMLVSLIIGIVKA